MFAENPLSLSISEPAFQAWLVDSPHENRSQYQSRSRNPDGHTLSHARSAPSSGSWQQYVPFLDTTLNFVKDVLQTLQSLPFPEPRISQQDLLKPPVPWTAGFWDCGDGPSTTFALPASWEEGVTRVRKNVQLYIGNYLRLAGCVLLCMLYLRPLSMIGLLLIALITHFSMGLALGDEVALLGYHLSPGSFLLRSLRVCMQIGVFVIMFYCRVFPALLWTTSVSFAVVLTHATLRLPAREGENKRTRKRLKRR